MDTRAAFDAFCRKRNLICEGERDKKLGYAYAETETAWQAYRAGALAMRERAAKEAEKIGGIGGNWPDGHEGDNAMTRAARTMMQDSGSGYAAAILRPTSGVVMSDTPDIAEAMRRARQEADSTLILSYGTPIIDLQRMLLWHRVYEKELRAIMGWEQMP